MGAAFNALVFSWLAMEVVLQVRERWLPHASRSSDRGTFWLLGAGIAAGVALGATMGRTHPNRALFVAAAPLVLVGAALRLWSVVTLGRRFRLVIDVSDSSTLVTRGPYRVVRHPSYLGLIACLVGVGVADGTVASALALSFIPLPGILRRIHIEERAMAEAFGPEYDNYRQRTFRLVPGLW